MSASAVHFKGTGWYVTDYAGKGKRAETADEKTSGSSDSATPTDKGKGKDSKAPKKPASSESAAPSKTSEK
jgi:hypothetical protein